MKHFVTSILLTIISISAFSQYFPGYETGRFSGISSANIRPGGMSPMPYKVDATILGVHVNSKPQNIFSKNALDVIFTGGLNNLTGYHELLNRTHVFTNLQGPSIQVQASPKASVSFVWNTRNIWLSNLTEPGVAQLFNPELPDLMLNSANESANIMITGWNEWGIGAAGVVYDEGFHSFSIGGFAKMVFGTGHANINMNNINLTTSGNTVNNMSFAMNTTITENLYRQIDEGRFNFADQIGYGFDFGLEYKFLNPRSCPGGSNYRAKFGLSLTDIGKTRYQSATHYTNDNASITGISRDNFLHASVKDATDSLQQLFNITGTPAADYSVMLPMSMRVYGEINIRRRAIIYNEFHFMFAQLTNPDMPVFFRYNVTPRFEDDRFGVYVPLTFTNYIPADAGLAIRLKPLIIGSGNLFTFWAYEQRGKALDFYVMLKIPILNDDERIDWKSMMSIRAKGNKR